MTIPAPRAATFAAGLPHLDGRAVQRLLIVKLSALGDVVQALPVAVALRRAFPALRITWAVEERWAALLTGHAAIDRVVAFPRLDWRGLRAGWAAHLRRARAAIGEEPYDLALDLQGLFKSAIVTLWSRAPRRLGAPLQREGAGLVSPPVARAAEAGHAVDEYLACAERLGAAADPVDFGVPIDPAAAASLARALTGTGVARDVRPIVINPSASSRAKQWPAERWRAVIESLAAAAPIVLIGAAEQARRHAALVRGCGVPVVDLTGRTTLAELVALLERGVLHIAGDTGSLHLAVALGRPVVGIYGPTSPTRLGPYGQSDNAVHHRELCGALCPRACRRRVCLEAIAAAEVVDRARSLIRG